MPLPVSADTGTISGLTTAAATSDIGAHFISSTDLSERLSLIRPPGVVRQAKAWRCARTVARAFVADDSNQRG